MPEHNNNQDLVKNSAELSPGFNSHSGPTIDGVARFLGCSGVLISSRIILTSGHCIDNRSLTEPGSRRKVWSWMRLKRKIDVFFGYDRLNPLLKIKASFYNSAGFTDIIMLLLDNPVPQDVAQPFKVLTRIPYGLEASGYFEGKKVSMSGWGNDQSGNAPRYRQAAVAKVVKFPFASFNIDNPNMMRVEGYNGATLYGGDSGSPLFYYTKHNATVVIGIAQGTESKGGRYVATFGGGGVTSRNTMTADVSKWIEHTLYSEVLPQAEEIVPLFTWWNDQRKDNYTTSHPDWSIYPSMITYGNRLEIIVQMKDTPIPENRYLKDGYGIYRHEGYLFSPYKKQPSGTIPLFSWWNENRKDNVITSKPEWRIEIDKFNINEESIDGSKHRKKEGYEIRRLEGYIFDPKLPQPPDTIPLFSWWNSNRGDNFASTNEHWRLDLTKIKWDGEELVSPQQSKEGYRCYRLEGFIFPNLIL